MSIRSLNLKKKGSVLADQKGMAMIEALPIVWVMFVLMGATLGSWGIVQTAILHSIAARNYTFFLFNNRADLSYLRDFADEEYPGLSGDVSQKYYREDSGEGHGYRFSYISSENPSGDDVLATLRKVDFRNITYHDRSDFLRDSEHSNIKAEITPRNTNKKVGPAWIMVGYGICLSAKCGDD